MIKSKLYILLIVLLSFSINIFGQGQTTMVLSDSARISLLTNSPYEKEIYGHFGHTSVRVRDNINNIDFVFNYGVFSFNTPNFIFRFVKGETDYMLAACSFDDYLFEYQYKQISVFEQILNLTQIEKQKIWDALCINALPQNRVYRYNFFFDNCSTRPRDIIEKNVSGTITYVPTNKKQSLRDLVQDCVHKDPWLEFGIDMLIGSGADKEASDMEKMFLPAYLKDAYDGAIITSPDTTRSLVLKEQFILDYRSSEQKKDSYIVNYPFITGCILLFITILFSALTFRKKNKTAGKIFDTILFLAVGVTGCIIAFLMFFSEHPCMYPNWNIVWTNPVQLVFAFLFFPKCLSKYIYYYHFINFALLSLFLACWLIIPQQLEIAFIPFILTLWVRSGTNIVSYKKISI